MKIIFYSGVFARIGGIEAFTRDLSLALIAKGINVEILCASLRNPVLDDLRKAGVVVRRVPVFHGCRWNLPDFALFPFARSWMTDADVVIHQKPLNQRFYALLPLRPKHIYLTSYSPAEQFGGQASVKKFFSFFDGIITQTATFENELREGGIDGPIHVLPLIPPEVSSVIPTQAKDRVLRIGMMGRLESQKNPLYAQEIVEALAQESSSVWSCIEFNVYGDGSLMPKLREKSESSKVKVIFHGGYAREDVARIVAENDFFLITSLSEGQCIVALEVLSGGRPLFATPVGALPVVLSEEKRGRLLPVDDAYTAAKQIKDWIDLHGQDAAASIQDSYLRDYDADSVRNQYVELMQRVVARS